MPSRPSPDDRLRTYRAKRDFSVTAEPEGTNPPAADGWRFVVQRHRATQLHYDLRLEAGGVLVSWAVPKGPTLDPAARRLAVHVEDHPLDYYDFEGVIAAGEYGGGDVIVWDWGTWTLVEGRDALDAIAAGDLHLAFDGDKLRGRFALVRRGTDGREQWLLIKKRDEDSVAGWDPEDHPRSVKSGRTNDEVRDAPAASWSSSASWAGATDEEVAALDAMGSSGTWSLGGHEVRLRDLDAVVAGKLTRRDLVRHHAVLAPAMLPYLADRLVEAVDAEGRRVTRSRHVETDSAAELARLAGRGAIELHPSLATSGDPGHPIWALFAVDDVELARLHQIALDHLELEGRPVLIGGDGVQIWVPIDPRYTAEHVAGWVATVSNAVRTAAHTGAAPDPIVPIAPFSVRPDGTVAVPVTWDELEGAGRWTVDTVGERLRRAGDPLAPLIRRRQRLPAL